MLNRTALRSGSGGDRMPFFSSGSAAGWTGRGGLWPRPGEREIETCARSEAKQTKVHSSNDGQKVLGTSQPAKVEVFVPGMSANRGITTIIGVGVVLTDGGNCVCFWFGLWPQNK